MIDHIDRCRVLEDGEQCDREAVVCYAAYVGDKAERVDMCAHHRMIADWCLAAVGRYRVRFLCEEGLRWRGVFLRGKTTPPSTFTLGHWGDCKTCGREGEVNRNGYCLACIAIAMFGREDA